MKNTPTLIVLGALAFTSGAVFGRPPHVGQLDANLDGSVTRAEVESDAASRAQELDTDGDGAITVEEIQAGHERRKLERIQSRLEKADANGDGVVSVDEFSSGMVAKVMSRDSDGDGVLTESDRPERGDRRPPPRR